MIAAGITALIVYLITIVIEIFLSAFLLIATFKVIDPKLNKQELRLGFTLALKLNAITYGVIMFALVAGFLTVNPLVILGGGLTAGIVYLVLLIQWFEMDLGTLILTFIVQWVLGITLGLLLIGLIAGLFSIAV